MKEKIGNYSNCDVLNAHFRGEGGGGQILRFPQAHFLCNKIVTHTHTHTHIYIYIYIYICDAATQRGSLPPQS
jgi:hypothetical protein